MQIMKRTLVAITILIGLRLFASAATPTVTDLTARQRYPWNGLVDISFTLSESGCIAVAATNAATGAAVPVRTLRDKDGNAVGKFTEFASGKGSLVWDAGTDVPDSLIETFVLSVVGAPPHGKVQLWEGGPYWATENIGADKPEDYGLYFWWGDTIGYRREGNAWVASDGSSQNFWFVHYTTPTHDKDNSTLQSEGWITEDGVLAPEHDAAHVHWGGAWRMPTKAELSAINDNCDWIWTTQGGVNGYVVRGRGNFAASSIFLPAAGYGSGTSLNDAGSYGYYWSSVPYKSVSEFAWGLGFASGHHYTSYYYRYGCRRLYGFSVRPAQGFAE